MVSGDSNAERGSMVRAVFISVLLLIVGGSLAYGVPELMNRRYATEAINMLGKLSRSASIYYVKPRGDEQGNRMLCQFPRGEIRTSLAKSCCDSSVNLPGTHLCDPARIEWNRTLWKALHFEIKEPHAFIYAYRASGLLGSAKMEVSAYGDLDCDGVYSTFRFIGQGDPAARHDDCVLNTTPVFSVTNEGE